jgi:glycerophosphoryl diester phosphodiesterase
MFLIIAHRGASGYEPENTLLSFKKAIELRAEMIELDVYACRTGELVVIHDNTVDRTTNGKGYVWDLSYKELRSLDAGKGEKIPALEEVLYLLGGRAKINLELKGPGIAEPVYKMVEMFVSEKKWSFSDFFISSFDLPMLKEFNSLLTANSEIKICPLIYGIPAELSIFVTQYNAYSLNVSADFINADFVNEAHRQGMKVLVYTINDGIELQRVKSFGIDGIFTNYPDINNSFSI